MSDRLPNNLSDKIRQLAYYQIVGGICGIGLVIWLVAQTKSVSGLSLLIFILAVSLYLFSIHCGRLLLKNKLDLGLDLSTYNQAIQVLNFALFGFAFKYASGLYIGVEIDYTDDFKFDVGLSLSALQINVNADKQIIQIGFNVLAVYLIYHIGKIREEVAKYRRLKILNLTHND
ncbi:hypothetical protein [Fibrella forsythiae]|uniref:DUF4199 domain-containing protein n=1 Tax=Fibrella forsythiae TaxID=2817061 RepID=A0ABS3JKZ0_9BACT|nr:hypothetical protein [Fibrella forsythiae]MBO0950677.1 hypothetical protein [Fibrella forsythiae]